MVIVRPARAGPSQICCPPSCKFPEGGTTRSACIADPSSATATPPGGTDTGACCDCACGTARFSRHLSWACLDRGGERAGDPQSQRRCGGSEPGGGEGHGQRLVGRSGLYSSRQASRAARSAWMSLNGPCGSSSSESCRA